MVETSYILQLRSMLQYTVLWIARSYPLWEVDKLDFGTEVKRKTLHSRGIFQNEPSISSNGVTTSNVIVLGTEMNSNILEFAVNHWWDKK